MTEQMITALAGKVSVNPNIGAGPGGAKVQTFLDWVAGLSLCAVLVGLIIAAAVWAFGHFGNSGHYNSSGVIGVLKAVGAAVLIGMAAQLVNWGVGLGAG